MKMIFIAVYITRSTQVTLLIPLSDDYVVMLVIWNIRIYQPIERNSLFVITTVLLLYYYFITLYCYYHKICEITQMGL